MTEIPRFLILAGLALVALGLLGWLGSKLGWPRLGNLPGDFVYHGKRVTLYLPLGTCLLLSVVLTLIAGFCWRR